MPTGRLTRSERRQIAPGDSLPYADTPRSPGVWSVRPRRSKVRRCATAAAPAASAPTWLTTPPNAAPTGAGPPPAEGRSSGLSTMTARVLTCVFTTDAGSLTASQLAQRLKVSPAPSPKRSPSWRARALCPPVDEAGTVAASLWLLSVRRSGGVRGDCPPEAAACPRGAGAGAEDVTNLNGRTAHERGAV